MSFLRVKKCCARVTRRARPTNVAARNRSLYDWKHEDGEKGTPFSQCVTAMAKLANGKTSCPRKACKELSKKPKAGEKGTPFSLCVSQGAKLLREHDDDGEK
jgi:hypothetical protein